MDGGQATYFNEYKAATMCKLFALERLMMSFHCMPIMINKHYTKTNLIPTVSTSYVMDT